MSLVFLPSAFAYFLANTPCLSKRSQNILSFMCFYLNSYTAVFYISAETLYQHLLNVVTFSIVYQCTCLFLHYHLGYMQEIQSRWRRAWISGLESWVLSFMKWGNLGQSTSLLVPHHLLHLSNRTIGITYLFRLLWALKATIRVKH